MMKLNDPNVSQVAGYAARRRTQPLAEVLPSTTRKKGRTISKRKETEEKKKTNDDRKKDGGDKRGRDKTLSHSMDPVLQGDYQTLRPRSVQFRYRGTKSFALRVAV